MAFSIQSSHERHVPHSLTRIEGGKKSSEDEHIAQFSPITASLSLSQQASAPFERGLDAEKKEQILNRLYGLFGFNSIRKNIQFRIDVNFEEMIRYVDKAGIDKFVAEVKRAPDLFLNRRELFRGPKIERLI